MRPGGTGDRELTVRGRNLLGEAVAVTTSGDTISHVRAISPDRGGDEDLWLLPGLVDIQVNGFAGYDLNGQSVTTADVAGVVQALWKHGVTRFCPTICTQSHERMVAALLAIARACEEAPWIDRAVIGVHVEGPYISPEDGPRGAHPLAHVRPPNWEELKAFQDASGGRIRLLTLAPEWPGAPQFIEHLVQSGIIAAIGHTKATRTDISAAVRAGARLSTHLGNGAHALLPRHPNYIWEQLAADDLWASVIVDGHHLPPSVVKVFVRAKGVDRCILISDAVWVAEQPAGIYRTTDQELELTPDRKVRLTGTGYLAGSALDLATAAGNVIAFADVSFADAVRMASWQPALLLNRPDLGRLAPGQAADMILVRWPGKTRRFEVVETVAAGETVYRA
jgi:N-acetylglucosamine-6-phosphate deacetylase